MDPKPDARPLTSGTRLGPYEILNVLGAGGMGEVYRAHDTKLGRDVALKILPPGFVDDPDRLARFEQEAQLLASLNHPYIGAIYGTEESRGLRALVLELIEGPTLGETIGERPMDTAQIPAIGEQFSSTRCRLSSYESSASAWKRTSSGGTNPLESCWLISGI